MTNQQLRESHAELLRMLSQVLGDVDYVNHCCGLTAMVGAALPVETIELARAAEKRARDLIQGAKA